MTKTMPAQAQSPAHLEKLHSYYGKVRDRFHTTHTKASDWFRSKSLEVDGLRSSSQQLLAAASLAGSIALNQPVDSAIHQQLQALQHQRQKSTDHDELAALTVDEHHSIMDKMTQFVQRPPGHLNQDEELYLEQQLSDMLGFNVSAELEGHRLNHSIGIMGGEQHLHRFPSDSLAQHDQYQESGIAPNRGAFGWFTENGVLTPEAIQREKYYFAVQTLYLPDWNTNHAQLKPWYKFRKMIVINPAEQVAAVGVVGDAGPAQWVGKQFGGSPEIIRDAKIWSKDTRGKIILLFVDDPENKVPLGIIDLSHTSVLAQAGVELES